MISKKTKSILQFIIGAAFVIFGTVVLVALARGFSYDFLTGQVKITGLVIIDSNPNGAKISVNSHLIKQKTPYRMTSVEPGKMTVELTKDKYHTWTKDFFVSPQQVSFVNYAWLIPKELKISHSQISGSVNAVSQSKNLSKIVYAKTSPTELDIFESRQSQKIYQADGQKQIKYFSDLQLSDSGANLIFRENSDSSSHYMYTTASKDQRPIDLNEVFKFNFSNGSLSFNPDNDRELFWLDNGSLRKINVDSQTVSSVMADKIVSVAFLDKKIFYVEDIDGKRNLIHMDLNGQKKTLLLTDLSKSSFYKMGFSGFDSVDYFAILTDDGKLTVIDHLYDANPKKNLFSNFANYFSFNKNGRFLLINNRQNLKTYDFEDQERLFNKGNFQQLKDLRWLDDYHLIAMDQNKLKMVDYDGQNNHTLLESNSFLPNVIANPNDKSVFVFETDPQGNTCKISEIFLTLKN